MKRVEVKLSLPVVAPLLDVVKEAVDDLRRGLVIPLPADDDRELHDAWHGELLALQADEGARLLGLFDRDFFATGMVAFDEANCESVVRACSAVRLRLREKWLKPLGDDALETGGVDLETLAEPVRKAFMCYLFLATIQDLIIQHLDATILGE